MREDVEQHIGGTEGAGGHAVQVHLAGRLPEWIVGVAEVALFECVPVEVQPGAGGFEADRVEDGEGAVEAAIGVGPARPAAIEEDAEGAPGVAGVDEHVEIGHGPGAEVAVREQREGCALEEHRIDPGVLECAQDGGDVADGDVVAEPRLAIDAAEHHEVGRFGPRTLDVA